MSPARYQWYDALMIKLIALVIVGLAFAYFAAQNAAYVQLSLVSYQFMVPVYAIILFSFLLGLVASLLFYLSEKFFSGRAQSQQEKQIAQLKQEKAELVKETHRLKLTNEKLNNELGRAEEFDEDSI